MEEEEEEVLCYLDRVLEEEEVFEYGDGDLEPITPLHRQFKVRQRLHSWMQGGDQADTCTCVDNCNTLRLKLC